MYNAFQHQIGPLLHIKKKKLKMIKITKLKIQQDFNNLRQNSKSFNVATKRTFRIEEKKKNCTEIVSTLIK